MIKKEQKKICDICGGSGQLSFFQGVSRFLLSIEECSECAGTGYDLNALKENKSGEARKKSKGKKKK